ncbi:LamG domain-containing protein [Nocardioides sp. MAHUQ-72]|uniref:LamG domain-containing protein n=1 Tax=unclassified Nocardioides TaxID=2615069 RepID=UPI00361D57B9
MGRVLGGIVGSAAALVLLLAQPCAASVVGDWQMDEPPGATAMVDSSGHGLTGDVGSLVQTGIPTPTGLGYRFSGESTERDPERLVVVPDDPLLDPHSRAYSVTLRFKTHLGSRNLVQKGQSGEPGGYWKVELHRGWPTCLFRDETGLTRAVGLVNGPKSWRADDRRWHTVRCERRPRSVRIKLDAGTPHAVTKKVHGRLGRIANQRPLMIGGKLDCSGEAVGCDYLTGKMDWLRIRKR